MQEQQVILVNGSDQPEGVAGKMEAHRNGLLHRAFSVFIFSSKGEMLLQQRALDKYHSGGLWTNACCSHPFPGEATADAAKRRLMDEMGVETELEHIGELVYNISLDNGLSEHEYDHLYAGQFDGSVRINKKEVMDYAFEDMNKLRDSLKTHPKQFTAWFHLAFPKIEDWWMQNY